MTADFFFKNNASEKWSHIFKIQKEKININLKYFTQEKHLSKKKQKQPPRDEIRNQ